MSVSSSQLENLLVDNRIEHRTGGKNVGKAFINICCVFCNEERFHLGIHHESLWYKCFVCGAGGRKRKLLYALNKKFPTADWQTLSGGINYYFKQEEKKEEEKPTYDHLIAPFDFNKDIEIVNYLTQLPTNSMIKNRARPRGFELPLIKDTSPYRGVNALDGYVVWKFGNSLIGRNYRAFSNKPKWYKYSDGDTIYGIEYIKKTKPSNLVLVEGLFDCFRFPLGWSIACLTNRLEVSGLGKLLDYVSKDCHIILAFDRDVKEELSYDIKMTLIDLGFKVTSFPWDLVKDENIGDMDELYLSYGSEFFKSMFSSIPFEMEELI